MYIKYLALENMLLNRVEHMSDTSETNNNYRGMNI